MGFTPLRAMAQSPAQKVVVVTFGGGARDEETFAVEGQQYIPHLLNDLIPQATFFTQVVNRGILGHYVATASLATGTYETFDNFAPVAPESPTIFEYFRRDQHRPAHDAWVIAPSNGFNRIGQSDNRLYGNGLGAYVVLPKQLLSNALGHGTSDYESLLRDNYESPVQSPYSSNQVDLHELANLMQLSVAEFITHARTVSSPDELSVYIAHQVMKQLAPSLLWITLHDIDIAHSGAFSLYTDGIRRTDRLCAELWNSIQSNPEYKGKTSMFILPDFGRDADSDPGGNGFQHHRTGDPLSRTTWMIAMGPGIRENFTVNRMVESVDLVPTLAAVLKCNARFSSGKPLQEVL
ncbi:hypothetical protein GCM10011507_19040 [Edaphobacter acidisoli]|uniref:Alkaline phosphatase family protein n=1 Tax=Edaphobacter acidisoli TaxID=2040573 RepID=A0A916RU54_9BACT|nr:hypothetical protein [Edaphobacter acidisoli]GGA67684.1 hypothetical protein GCM10011507_19040 [Edaphobacter acidisoli]